MNPYIWVPFATWVVAQIGKFGLAALRGKPDLSYLYASGGMPSVHSAVVVSLAVTALLREGSGSPLFGVTTVLAAIVMYDSFGVRRSTGEQATAINTIMDTLVDKVKMERPKARLREILGHKPLEVSVGAVLGLVLGGLFNFSYLGNFLEFMGQFPHRFELWVYLGLFLLLIIGGWLTRLWQVRNHPKSEAWADLARHILIKTQAVGWLGLIVALMQLERIPVFGTRAWSLAIVIGLVIWDAWLINKFTSEMPARLAQEASARSKLQWLLPKKRKKRK